MVYRSMKMNRFLKFVATTIVAATIGSVLSAQEAEKDPWIFELSLGYTLGTGIDMKAILDGTAYTGGVALPVEIGEGLYLRPHLTAVMLKGTEGSGYTLVRPNFYAGVDVKADLPYDISVFAGFIGMSWNQSARTKAQEGPLSYKFGVANLGARVGVEYKITDLFSAHVAWTLAEGSRVYNPSWLTVGAAVKF
jgi:hypothetical protein